MSHTVSIKTLFKHKNALFTAFKKLGWEIKENTTCRTYPSDPARGTKYQFGAINPRTNGYDIGLTYNEAEGTYNLNCDFYDRSIGEQLGGTDVGKLKQQYIMAVAEEEMGEVEIMEQLADGSLIIEVDDGE